MQKCFIESDASCVVRERGGTAPMRIGYVIRSATGATIARVGEYVGEGTINIAEYYGLIHALRQAIRLGFTHAECKTDSQLLAYQVSGTYKAKDERIQRLLREVLGLSKLIRLELNWTNREGNVDADGLTHQTVSDIAVAPAPPPRKHTGWGRNPDRDLPDWQAHQIRLWLTDNPDLEPVVSRAFATKITYLRQITRGLTYKDATGDGRPDWSKHEGLPK